MKRERDTMDRNRSVFGHVTTIWFYCALVLAANAAAGLQAATRSGLNACNPCAANPRQGELLVGFANDTLIIRAEICIEYYGDRDVCDRACIKSGALNTPLGCYRECLDGPLSWNPPGVPDCGNRPVDPDPRRVWERSYIHFKVLSSDGQCMFFNSRLGGTDTGGDLAMRLPVGEILSERNIAFWSCSDFRTIEVGMYSFDDCVLVPGETYTIEINEQASICGSSLDKERVLARKIITVPYAIRWCDVPVEIK